MRLPRCAGYGLAGLFAASCLPVQAQSPKAMSEAEMKAAGGRQLQAAELRQKLVGNTVHVLFLKRFGPWPQGMALAMFYRDDRNRATAAGRGRKNETIWWFEGNDVCGEQRTTASHDCYRFHELAGTIYLCETTSADCIATVRFMPGNPEQL
jgi:hypothetical protein